MEFADESAVKLLGFLEVNKSWVEAYGVKSSTGRINLEVSAQGREGSSEVEDERGGACGEVLTLRP